MKNLGFKKSTIFRAIRRVRRGGPVQDKPRSSRPSIINNRLKAEIRRCANKLGMGLRKIGLEYEVSHTSVRRILTSAGIIYRKRKKCPEYTDKGMDRDASELSS